MSARLRRLVIAVVAAALVSAAAGASAGDLVIHNARLIDGTGAPPREGVAIRIRDGRIAEIAATGPVADGPALDARGATVLPGLIDAHVHMKSGPGAALRTSTAAERRELLRQHLRAYLACGVTTVLDAGATPGVVHGVRTVLAAGVPGPRYLTLGPFLRPPGGYPDDPQTAQAVASPAEVDAVLNELAHLGVVGIKVPLERGWAPWSAAPLHSAAMRTAIRDAARARDLPIYVHATSTAEQLAALELGAHALMHPILYRDAQPSEDFVRRLAAARVYQVSTLSILDAPLGKFEPERLRDPLLDLVVPPAELASARGVGGWEEARVTVARMAPWLPRILQDGLARWVFREAAQRNALRASQATLRRLHRAGVPIVVGSDTPYQSWAVYAFHGPTTLREIELLVAAGLTPMEALQAATRVPAEMLGLGDELGTVEVGKRADLVVVRGDPLADPRALRRVMWTVRDGVAGSPAEWMAR